MFALIRLCRCQGIADDGTNPVRKPPFDPEIDRQGRKDCDQYGWDERDQGEDAGKAKVKARSGRFGAARSDHLHDTLQDESRDDKNVDKVGQEDEAQAGRVCALIQRAEDKKCKQRKNRPKDHEPKGRKCLKALLTP